MSCLLFTAACLFAGTSPAEIDGTWTLVSVTTAGRSLDGLAGSTLVMRAGKKTFTLADGTTEHGTYRLDTTTSPRRIDTTTDGTAEAGKGIYRVTGDTLTMHLCPAGSFRPTDFTMPASGESLVFEFQRAETIKSSSPPRIVPLGDRLLGIGINEGSIGFGTAFAAAQKAGVQVIELPQHWDDIEPSPGVYTNRFLDIANAFYPAHGIQLVISFNPIDTNSLRVPADLRGKPLDDACVIERYTKAVDYVVGRIPTVKLVGFAIGNEIDGVLGENERRWEQYARFFKATSDHVRTKLPGVPVGAKTMLPALIGSRASLAARVNAHADVIMATYYPLGSEFRVKDLGCVAADIDTLLSLPGKKPVYLLEAGCPSSERINSSPAKQARFVREVFAAWDRHGDRLKLVNFIWLHDIAAEAVNSYTKYYGIRSTGFMEYLGTLGMRTHDGSDKPAFTALCEEMQVRRSTRTPPPPR